MLAAFRGDTSYDIVLVLHILCSVFGFGAVVLNGVYGAQIKGLMQSGRAREAVAVFDANHKVSKIGQLFIYAVFLLGFALVGISDGVWEFHDAWIGISIGLFVVALGISHGLLMPRVNRMGALMRELAEASGPPPAGGPPPQALELAKLGPQVGVIGATLDLFLIVLVCLMVFKP